MTLSSGNAASVDSTLAPPAATSVRYRNASLAGRWSTFSSIIPRGRRSAGTCRRVLGPPSPRLLSQLRPRKKKRRGALTWPGREKDVVCGSCGLRVGRMRPRSRLRVSFVGGFGSDRVVHRTVSSDEGRRRWVLRSEVRCARYDSPQGQLQDVGGSAPNRDRGAASSCRILPGYQFQPFKARDTAGWRGGRLLMPVGGGYGIAWREEVWEHKRFAGSRGPLSLKVPRLRH